MDHRFGGIWTERKLQVLQDYLQFFPVALGNRFELVYIDTFAGTGKCTISLGANGEKTINGSARIALDLKRPFDRYFFIESRGEHVTALEELKATHSLGGRVGITHGDAHHHLEEVLAAVNWKVSRGVLFLDPYGLQCSWDMVKKVAATEALDVFFLVNVAGLARQAAKNAARIDSGKAAILDRFLGTGEWRTALYKAPNQPDMFISEPSHRRETGVEAIVQFVQHRMEGVFAHVAEPLLLRGGNNAVLFALFFAVSNRGPAAKGLAAKVSNTILSKLRS